MDHQYLVMNYLQILKPVHDYNKSTGRVDRFDQMLTAYLPVKGKNKSLASEAGADLGFVGPEAYIILGLSEGKRIQTWE
jgi:hypothetical protein